MHGTTVKKKF